MSSGDRAVIEPCLITAVHAESEFETYRVKQDRQFESDFDRVVKAGEALANVKDASERKGRGRRT